MSVEVVMGAPAHAESAWYVRPAAAESASGVSDTTGATLPNASRLCTVSPSEHVPAMAVRAGFVKTMAEAAAGRTTALCGPGPLSAEVGLTATVLAVVPSQ